VFLPDPLEAAAELALAEWPWQPLPAQSAADPPDLQSSEGQGKQPQLQVAPVQLLHIPQWRSLALSDL
jgi:hypothetical protein